MFNKTFGQKFNVKSITFCHQNIYNCLLCEWGIREEDLVKYCRENIPGKGTEHSGSDVKPLDRPLGKLGMAPVKDVGAGGKLGVVRLKGLRIQRILNLP